MVKADRAPWFRKDAAAVLLLVLVSYAAGIFLFDLGLVIFKMVRPDGVKIFADASGLGRCFLSALFAFVGLILLSVIGGALWARKNGKGMTEGFARQTWTFGPALALAFGRFVDGRAVHYIVPVPLFPLLVGLVLLAIVYLNARLHRDFRPRPLIIPADEARRKRFRTVVWSLLLASFLAHLMTLNPYFPRYSSYMIFAGDEPKYLRMAYSLAHDGDLDLTDDFVGDDLEISAWKKQALATGSRRIGDYSVLGRDGGIYHFHMPGLSALILPAFLLDLKAFPRDIPNTQPLMFLPSRMPVTRAWLMIIAVIFFWLMARFYDRLFPSRLLVAFLLLASIFLTKIPEFLLQIYPETAAGICLFLGLNALIFPFQKTGANRLALIAGIGFLPWLHQRYLPLALSLYILFLVQAWKSQRRWKDILAVSLPLGVIGFGYCAYFYFITGSPMPWSLYSLWGTSYTRAAVFPSGFFGYLFDTSSGLTALFPVFLFALIGFYWGFRKDRRIAAKLFAVILPYFFLICITPWHGIAWETTRMSLILFPLFIIFAGFAIRALSAETSWAHLLFYGGALAFLLLNKGGRYWEISLGNVLIQSHQVGYIVQCALVLVAFYLALWGLDRLAGKKRIGPPISRGIRLARETGSRLRLAAASPAAKKSLIAAGLAVFVLYGAVFLNNWRDKSLAPSYFQMLTKLRRISDPRFSDGSGTGLLKSDDAFRDRLPRDIPFEISPGVDGQRLRLGPAPLLETCPAGRYWLGFEFIDTPPEFNGFFMDFMGETRKVVLDSGPGNKTAAVSYLLFDDLKIVPEILFRFTTRLTRTVKAKLHLSPIPCYVFDRRLIIMPGDDYSPRPLRTIGPQTYLTLSVIARDPHTDFVFDLSLLTPSAGGGESVLFTHRRPLDLGKPMARRFNIPLEFLPPVWPGDAIFAVAITEGSGRRLWGKSVVFPSGDVIRLRRTGER